jgi:hypothetical protein
MALVIAADSAFLAAVDLAATVIARQMKYLQDWARICRADWLLSQRWPSSRLNGSGMLGRAGEGGREWTTWKI